MNNIFEIAKYLKNYKKETALNVFFNILNIIFGVFTLASIMPFLDIIFETSQTNFASKPTLTLDFESVKNFAYYHIELLLKNYDSKAAGLMFVAVFVIATTFLKNLFRYLASHFIAPIRNGIVRDIRNSLAKKILDLPMSFFSKERKGDLISRMTADVVEVEHGILSVLEVYLKEPLNILIVLFLLFLISAKLTLIVFALIIVIALVIGTIGKTLKKQSHEGQERLGFIASLYDEMISGMRIIKAFGAEKYKEKQFEKENQYWYSLMNKVMRKRFLSSPLTEFLAVAVLAAVLWFGGKEVLDGNVGASTLIFYLMSFAYIISPAKSFASAHYNVQKGAGALKRINEIFSAPNVIEEKLRAKSLTGLKDKIEFENVSFAYRNYDDKLILNDINLTIKKGNVVALVGPSGAGKTTLADLLPRFYDVDKGAIKIDGTDIRNIKKQDLRKLMGVVTQESILFNDSVKNNIAFGLENVSDEEIVEASKIANAHEFIVKLENGYDTIIGDMGNNLSGGQKQRLTIARAVLKNPPILILDEATSSLDSESEKLVQDALNKLMKNRTSIVIAHRLSTIQFADEIVVVEDGNIVERGNHIGLMAKSGLYKRLVELQEF